MPPSNKEFNDANECDYAKEWLDKQKDSSVLYVAPGSEAVLSQQEFSKLAHALERSKLRWLGNGSQLQLLLMGSLNESKVEGSFTLYGFHRLRY